MERRAPVDARLPHFSTRDLARDADVASSHDERTRRERTARSPDGAPARARDARARRDDRRETRHLFRDTARDANMSTTAARRKKSAAAAAEETMCVRGGMSRSRATIRRRRRARMRGETTFMRFRDSERRIDAIESARATDEDERRSIA